MERKCEFSLRLLNFFWDQLFFLSFAWSIGLAQKWLFLSFMAIVGIVTKNYTLEAGILRVKKWAYFLKLAIAGVCFLALKGVYWQSEGLFILLFFLERWVFFKVEWLYREKWDCYKKIRIVGNKKEEILKKIKKFPELNLKVTEQDKSAYPVSDFYTLVESDFLGHRPLFYIDGLKRIFDFTSALFLLIISLPLFFLIAVLIKKDSAGPIFFVHERIGKNGKPFKLIKFRTMYVSVPKYEHAPTSINDTRITRIGRWLRRSGLDELPQLINVLKGEMSLVGPRPEMPFLVNTRSEMAKRRLQVLPGITGLWQISKDRSDLIYKNLEYDLFYIKHRSFFVDLVILFKTMLVIFTLRGKEK